MTAKQTQRKTAAKKATKKKATTKALAKKDNGSADTTISKWTKTEVNEKVREGKRLYRSHQGTGYDFAKWMEEAHNGDLWVSDGFDTWEKFIEERIGCDRSYAHILMRCKQLYTKDQFLRLGTGHMKLMLTIPEAKREELLNKIKEQKYSVRQTEAEVREIKKKLPATTERTKTKTGKTVQRTYTGARGRPRVKLDISELVGKHFTHVFKDGQGVKEFVLDPPKWKLQITAAKLRKGLTVDVQILPTDE